MILKRLICVAVNQSLILITGTCSIFLLNCIISSVRFVFNWYSALEDNRREGIGSNNYVREMEQYMRDTLETARTSGDKVIYI